MSLRSSGLRVRVCGAREPYLRFRRTSRRILFYSIALIPVSLLPFFVGMSGVAYLASAFVLGLALLYFGFRLTQSRLQPSPGVSKRLARQLLQASVIYLPILFALMMIDTAGRHM